MPLIRALMVIPFLAVVFVSCSDPSPTGAEPSRRSVPDEVTLVSPVPDASSFELRCAGDDFLVSEVIDYAHPTGVVDQRANPDGVRAANTPLGALAHYLDARGSDLLARATRVQRSLGGGAVQIAIVIDGATRVIAEVEHLGSDLWWAVTGIDACESDFAGVEGGLAASR